MQLLAVYLMGSGPQDGVVSSLCQLFGEKGTYVADGAAVPQSVGANPSVVIATLAQVIT